jgi:hypothetical protein
MGRLSYVCAACSENFTRKYSATRHNINIHSGRAEIVRLLDYIVGRVSGAYLPSHPSWYKREQKRPTSSDLIYDNKFRRATVADTVGDTFQPRDGPQQAARDNMYKTSHNSTSPIFQPTHTADHQWYGTGLSHVTKLKIEELKTLLNKYQAYYADVNEIFKWAVSWSNKGNDKYLDEKLAMLRDLDKTARL